jgi:hypothetical protein
MQSGADQELVGLTEENKGITTIIGPFFLLHTAFIILLDARVLRGPVAESLVSAASLGYYLLYSLMRWVCPALASPGLHGSHSP